MNETDKSLVTDFAKTEGLSIKFDPYHGSIGVEFGLRRDSQIAKIGFLWGANEVVVYERESNAWSEFFHDRFWLFESLFSRALRQNASSFRQIGSESLGLSCQRMIQIVKTRLLTSRR